MDQGAVVTPGDARAADGAAARPPVSPAAEPAPPTTPPVEQPPAAASPRRSRLALDLSLLAVVGVLLIAALAVGANALYRELYSPSAFVSRYLDLLAEGRAADALAIPGVAVSAAQLEMAGMPSDADEALLRPAALAQLSEIEVLSEETAGDVTRVTVSYLAGTIPGVTTFRVTQDGMIGVAPTWRFETSPLAVIDLTVLGSMEFGVNGFVLDKRQVSPDGVEADPLTAVPLLVFSPGIYSISVDTAMAESPGVVVLSDSPQTQTPVVIQAHATAKFQEVVQNRVEEFLTACATQEVLQPTGCPFGFFVRDRVASPPAWSIVQQPQIQVDPDGAGWKIPAADATARIEVDVQSLFDGSITSVTEDVPFVVTGSIAVLPDGSASIIVSGPDAD